MPLIKAMTFHSSGFRLSAYFVFLIDVVHRALFMRGLYRPALPRGVHALPIQIGPVLLSMFWAADHHWPYDLESSLWYHLIHVSRGPDEWLLCPSPSVCIAF